MAAWTLNFLVAFGHFQLLDTSSLKVKSAMLEIVF